MTHDQPPIPTGEQCGKESELPAPEGFRRFAIWYPQMGGYVGRCVVQFDTRDDNTCFDAFVWHDGEFPFHDLNPAIVHHCDADQFVEFGEAVKRMQQAPAKGRFSVEAIPEAQERLRREGKL